MAHEDPEKFREILEWAGRKTWNLSVIREFYENTDAENYPLPERIGVFQLPTTDAFKHFCRYW